MSKDATLDLLAAFRAAILSDESLSPVLNGRVFSSWDNQEVATPFIRLSVPTSRQYECDGGGEGSEADVYVHIFTTESAPIECRRIAAKVRDCLERRDLTLAGSNLVGLDYRDTIARRDDQSPVLQMAVVRFFATTTTR